MTPASLALIAEFKADADSWQAAATDPDIDYGDPRKQRAIARRNALDYVCQRLQIVLDEIEAQAVEEYRGVADWLEAGGGVAA